MFRLHVWLSLRSNGWRTANLTRNIKPMDPVHFVWRAEGIRSCAEWWVRASELMHWVWICIMKARPQLHANEIHPRSRSSDQTVKAAGVNPPASSYNHNTGVDSGKTPSGTGLGILREKHPLYIFTRCTVSFLEYFLRQVGTLFCFQVFRQGHHGELNSSRSGSR